MKEKVHKRIFGLGTGLLLFHLGLWSAAAAEFTLPRLEMASRGRMNDGEFVVSSSLSADIALSGGYKYAFLLGFSLEAQDLTRALAHRNFKVDFLDTGASVDPEEYNVLADKLNNQAYLGFRVARATIRDIFGLPLEFSYFIGEGDNFCTGDDFSSRFGIYPVGTDFRGFFHFPEGIGGVQTRQYNGIHGVRGTGFSFTLTKWDNIVPMFYLYNNILYNSNVFQENSFYSGDLRLLYHHGWLSIEGFTGVSFDSAMASSLRWGLMLHIAPGNGAEFFAQAGIPGWTTGEKINIDNWYFLMEPRLRLGNFGLAATFFYRPVEYIHVYTEEEKGKADINIKFQFGNPDSGFTGGFETGGELTVVDPNDFVYHISPFVSYFSGGIRWDAKIRIKPLNFDAPGEIFEFFIGVRTAF